MALKVVVSGGGIGGLALAHWLDQIGATTVVVERAPQFKALGHYISLKGNGVEMVRRMGILDRCEACAAPLEEVRFFTTANHLIRSERTTALAKTLGGYILFRRADLQTALFDLVRDRTDIRFGVEVTSMDLTPSGVNVRLSDGRTESADLLVGADGIHSRVRGLVFGDGFERPLGGYYIALTQALVHGMPAVVHCYLGTGIMINLFPVAVDALSAVIYLGPGAASPPQHEPLVMRDYLLGACGQFPSEVRQIVGSIRSDDFMFTDAIAQVGMPHITQTRCALVGDAAHCPTFLSGMGTSLALQDAHILAGCLARIQHLGSALTQYEHVMTPIAQRYRDSALTAHRALLDGSRAKAGLRNAVLRFLPQRLLERGTRRFFDAERPLADVPSIAAVGVQSHSV